MQGYADVHEPVMEDRIVELLRPALQRPGSVYVDGTLGLAGHAIAVLEACPEARLIGIDRDPDAHAVTHPNANTVGQPQSARQCVTVPAGRLGQRVGLVPVRC